MCQQRFDRVVWFTALGEFSDACVEVRRELVGHPVDNVMVDAGITPSRSRRKAIL